MFEVLHQQGSSLPSQERSSSEPSNPASASASTDDSTKPPGTGSRRRVSLDDRAKRSPGSRQLPEIPAASSSGGSADVPPARETFLAATIEIRRATLLVFGFASLLLMALSYMTGKSTAPVQEPAGIAEMERTPVSDDSSWPLLDPEPGIRPAIRNIVQQAVAPSSADSTQNSDVVVAVASVADVVAVPVQQNLYAVWIGQHLSKDPAVIDKLVQYVDSGLTRSKARVRISDSVGGKRYFSVYVGPFENLDDARSALREIQVLRPHQGVRFRDAFPTNMVFTSVELQNFQMGR
ncbi:MAG: hypothetical protein OSB09_00815 [Planctomycetota bacterium]|nr:hypothetical protein [Planctomycetota bacterium]